MWGPDETKKSKAQRGKLLNISNEDINVFITNTMNSYFIVITNSNRIYTKTYNKEQVFECLCLRCEI